MLKVGLGQSENIDTLSAVRNAIEQCRQQLGRLIPQAGIVFAGIDFDHELMVQEIYHQFPGLALTGCTTGGELSSNFGFSDDSISLLLFYADRIKFAVGRGLNASENPAAAVKTALDQARQDLAEKESLCFLFPDAFSGTLNGILLALNKSLGPHCPIFGGAAGRQLDTEKAPRQFFRDTVMQDAVSLMLVAGKFELEFCISNSWEPIGMREKVTQVAGKEILRIGAQTALDFYRYYLGRHFDPVPEMPLAVFEKNDIDFYIRTPLEFNEERGSISFTAPIPLGATVQLTEATRERILENTRTSLQSVVKKVSRSWHPSAALMFSCFSRKQILGTRTREELQILENLLPDRTPISGFYSWSEFSPLQPNQSSRLHNCTLVTVILGERNSVPPTEKMAENTQPSIKPAPDGNSRPAKLVQENRFLRKKLERSEKYRERLELTKDFNALLLKQINRDINNARLEIQRKNELLRQTLSLADEIQKNMLPGENPDTRYFQIAGKSIYCSETGGDYYDYLNIGDDSAPFSIVIGDVTGHGIEAALLMTTARALIRSHPAQPGTISEIITDVNRHLTSDIAASGHFMTLFYLVLDPIKRCLHWVRAGHDAAISYDPTGDRFEELGGPGLALGVDASFFYEEHKKDGLAKNQILFMGTDGIWETRNPKGDMFGKAPIYDIIRQKASCDAVEIVDSVIGAMNAFRQDLEPNDDATLVVVKVKRSLSD
jgi:phosphoserine phosphatase RsbU/P